MASTTRYLALSCGHWAICTLAVGMGLAYLDLGCGCGSVGLTLNLTVGTCLSPPSGCQHTAALNPPSPGGRETHCS